ncbi:MFS transporter [Sphingomonas faeni]|nr:MFS transporter [Sphingomonas faeni]
MEKLNASGARLIKRIVTVFATLHCLAFIDRTMIAGALPLMRLDVAMSDAQAGWIVGTAFAIPYGITALTLAAVLRGRQASIGWLIGGVVVWTTATLVTGTAQSSATLTVARAGLGIGQAMFVPVAIAWLVDTAGTNDRARALSLFTSGSTIGRSTALLTVGALLSALAVMARDAPGSLLGDVAQWRWLFVITALPNIIMLPLLVSIRTPTRDALAARAADRPDPDPPRGPRDASVSTEVHWWTFALFLAAAIMPILLIQAMGAWLPTLFVRDRGLQPAQAAILLGAITLFAAPAGQLAAGWLMTRYASWHGHIPAIILAGLATALLPLAGLIWAPGLTGAVIGVALTNLILGIASFCGLFGVQLLSPAATRVTVNGIFLALVTLFGVGVGPLLTGVLATIAGTGTAGTSIATGATGGALGTALFATGVIASGVCGLAAVAVRHRYRQQYAA